MHRDPAVTRRRACRSCGSPDLRLVLALPPTPAGDHYVHPAEIEQCVDTGTGPQFRTLVGDVRPTRTYPLDLQICETCGLAQLGTVLDPDSLYHDYLYRTAHSLGLRDHFDRYAATVTARMPRTGFVVDVGSNDGTLLHAFQTRGWRVLGIDPAVAIAAEASAAGIPTISHPLLRAAEVPRLRHTYGSPDVITANHVIANLDDLHDCFAAVRAWLAPDGLFVFETGYFPDLVAQRLIETIEHEHLSYFTVRSVEQLLRADGLTLAAVEHLPVKGGAMRGYATITGARVAPQDRGALDALLRREFETPMASAAALQDWAAGIAALRDELRTHLDAWATQGKTVVGYGASVGATTLTYWLGLFPQMRWIADDNPARHGLLTPGHHLPVVPSDRLYTERPDVVLILAWRYADAILARHARYLAQGGQFVLPLPTVRVITADR